MLLKRYKWDAKDFDLKKLSIAAAGFTGAEIEDVIKSTMFRGYADDKRKINTQDLITELSGTIPQSVTNEADIIAMREGAKGKLRIAADDGTARDLVKPEVQSSRKIRVNA